MTGRFVAPLPPGPPPAADRDARLAALLERLAADVQAGRAPDPEALARAHPDLADELRALWGAVLVAEQAALGRRADDLAETLPPRSAAETPLAGSGSWPRTFGEFELLAELGRGGMGIVYQARQHSPRRLVALKVVLHGALAAPEDLARFRAEAEHVARLDHPHVVPVYEVGQVDGQPYFTMKHLEGTTLARRLADGPLPPRQAAALLLPVARAIHYAHQHGIVHRDLKPSNILVDQEGQPHVTDFGLAKRVEQADSFTHPGAILGTPAYMAPEQAGAKRGKPGPAVDVYSLGAILYEMLTGRPPFQAPSPVETVLMVLEQDPVPPRLLNSRADAELEMIALKCLQKPPELRYLSAGALADDLAAYLAGEPVSARGGQLSHILARWFRETQHAVVLENWGLLWIWHSLALLVISVLTNALQWRGQSSPWPYLGLWVAGLGAWAAIFWALRRRAGPVTFVERQIAHVWAASMASIALLFLVELLLGLPVLTLSPVLAITSGMVFLVKAGILTGRFYLQAAALFLTAPLMAWLESRQIPLGISVFGLVSAACFFWPGLKYYRQRRQAAPAVLAAGQLRPESRESLAR
jgi:serine/threonine-protein kinase